MAQDYRNTIVSPLPDAIIHENENIVYTSAFHMSWKNLQDNILKEEIKLKNDISYVPGLNNHVPVRIDEDNAVSLAGFVDQGIAQDISTEMRRKFHKEPDLSAYTRERSTIICYAYFQKFLQFNTTFESYGQAFPFYCNGKLFDIYCFGIWNKNNGPHHEELKKLVRVYDFISPGDFIISISNPGEEEELIIAMSNPEKTLQETIDLVIRRMHKSGPTELAENDRLILPKVQFSIQHTFQDFIGEFLLNPGFEEYFFAEASQEILFNLDESGAMADAEAKIILKKGPGPRTMMVNRPFLIMMKEKGEHQPYFAAWIANPELFMTSPPERTITPAAIKMTNN
jgi:hypothetical protein